VLRASAAGEAAGVPSSTLVCEGFMGLAAASSIGLGMPNLPVARVIGHPGVQSKEQLAKNVLDVTLEQVIDNLLKAPKAATKGGEPGPRDVIVKGSYDEVNDYFYGHELSDGLPIVPPTREKVERFLSHTDRHPDESLGALLPDSRAATIWSIAVNGVMAGCRPEHMPVLVALIEAMADHAYGVEHSGKERHIRNVKEQGNIGAAGCPSSIAQYMDKLHKGDQIVYAVLGAGLAWGGGYMEVQ
jgi:hypothetical protein